MQAFSNSILSLVIWRITATTAAFVAIMTMIIYVQIDRTLLMLKDRTLVDQVFSIASYIEKDEGSLTLDLPDAETKFFISQGKMYQYVIRNRDGNVLFHSPVAFIDRFPAVWPENETSFYEFTGPWGTVFNGISLVYDFDGQQYLVQAAQSVESLEAITDLLTTTFLRKVALIGVPFVLLLITVIYWSIRQSLEPLKAASRQAQAISFEAPEMRIGEKEIPEEIVPLVHAFNEALDRLREGVTAQREFTANAAHELQTPLTILLTQIEALEDTAAKRRLKKDVQAMSRLIRQLLDIARLDFQQGLEQMGTISLDALVQDVCRDYAPILVREKRQLSVKGSGGEIQGDYNTLYRALRNVIDNAVAHTPEQTPIDIQIDGYEVSIRDHGPGISPENRKSIFHRFWREDHSNSTGSGLGLSIVKRIMDLHHGKVSVTNHKKGGAIFTLSFPAPDTHP